ncbi:MAG TPA: hypothetical protein VFZ59_05920, partial [Verrucomicrobiae bacterium]|nr:hypothetical protein [Verrucomicrobiae bacterium]
SFKATPSTVPNRIEWPNLSVDVKDWLVAGGVFTPTEWFGALGAKDAADRYRAGERLPTDFPVNPKTESRHLYRGLIKTEDNRSQFPTLERLGTAEYRDAAFIRSGRLKPWLQLAGPDSVLFTYRYAGQLSGSLLLERIDSTGKAHWTTDTGIGTLRQVLPDTNVLALVGERSPVPNKVSEPILVLVNTVTGATNTVSLWR